VFLPEPFCGGGFLGLLVLVPDARLFYTSRVSDFLAYLFFLRPSSRRCLSGGPNRFLNTGCGFHQVANIIVSINIPLLGYLCKHMQAQPSILKLRCLGGEQALV
jgi:hypothetical protein